MSSEYKEFLYEIGAMVPLLLRRKFSGKYERICEFTSLGNLDTTLNATTGKNSLFAQLEGNDIMFCVPALFDHKLGNNRKFYTLRIIIIIIIITLSKIHKSRLTIYRYE